MEMRLAIGTALRIGALMPRNPAYAEGLPPLRARR